MANASNAIDEFWLLFQQRATDLAMTKSADTPVYDALLEQLQKIAPGLYFEFSVSPGEREMIVTADGDSSLFPLARAIVTAAPVVDGWTIRALKPKLGFPESIRWEGLELKIEDIVFEPLEGEETDELELRILIPGLDQKDVEDAHNAILRAMDHGLGEEKLAEAVQYTEVCPLPTGATTSDFIPLVELDNFIEWRERKRGGHIGSPGVIADIEPNNS
jgi:hypothetical protein